MHLVSWNFYTHAVNDEEEVGDEADDVEEEEEEEKEGQIKNSSTEGLDQSISSESLHERSEIKYQPLPEEESIKEATKIVALVLDPTIKKYESRINSLASSHQQGIQDRMMILRSETISKVSDLLKKKGFFDKTDASDIIQSLAKSIKSIDEEP